MAWPRATVRGCRKPFLVRAQSVSEKKVSPKAARFIVEALDMWLAQKRRDRAIIFDEDELADLENDIAYVETVRKDLASG